MSTLTGFDPRAAETKLKFLAATADGDPENAHIQADEILCEALKSVGYDRLVYLWRQVPKWFA